MSQQSLNLSNPSLYRELSKPFPTKEAANAALVAFQEELGELRKKHRLADVTVVVSVSITYPDGEEGDAMIVGGYGSTTKRESMLAYAYGKERAENEAALAKMLKGRLSN